MPVGWNAEQIPVGAQQGSVPAEDIRAVHQAPGHRRIFLWELSTIKFFTPSNDTLTRDVPALYFGIHWRSNPLDNHRRASSLKKQIELTRTSAPGLCLWLIHAHATGSDQLALEYILLS